MALKREKASTHLEKWLFTRRRKVFPTTAVPSKFWVPRGVDGHDGRFRGCFLVFRVGILLLVELLIQRSTKVARFTRGLIPTGF